MQEEMPGVTDSQCDQKWRNLKKKWKKYVDGQKKTGRGKKPRPEFYDEIADILATSHTVNPPHVLETLSVAPGVPDDSSLTARSSSQSPLAVSVPSSGPPASLAAAGPSIMRPSSAAQPTPSSTYTPMAAAGPVKSGQSPALAGAGDLSPVTGETMESGQRKRMRPASTKDKLEVKLDRLIEQQMAAQQLHEKHLGEMRLMFQHQHDERMTVLKGLVKAISKKSKKARRTEHSGSSSSS